MSKKYKERVSTMLGSVSSNINLSKKFIPYSDPILFIENPVDVLLSASILIITSAGL